MRQDAFRMSIVRSRSSSGHNSRSYERERFYVETLHVTSLQVVRSELFVTPKTESFTQLQQSWHRCVTKSV